MPRGGVGFRKNYQMKLAIKQTLGKQNRLCRVANLAKLDFQVGSYGG
jgi:hypothetical protein